MLDASLVMLTSLATPFLVTGKMLPRTGDTGYSGSPSAAMYVTRDGERISLGVVQNNQFALLCEALGRPELAHDVRFRDPPARANPQHATVLRTILASAFQERTGDEWEALLGRHGIPFGRVRSVDQVCTQDYLVERGLVVPVDIDGLPQGASGHYVNAGFVCDTDGPGANVPPPRLGEHTRAIMRELGYAADEIERLCAEGISLNRAAGCGRACRPAAVPAMLPRRSVRGRRRRRAASSQPP
jgi:crotonobetainyl-CoA:carnitine CoA-transferase CaiB-like acyl-CoA transferase